MISSPNADEAVVSFEFLRNAGFAAPADAIGKTIEFLVPAKGAEAEDNEEDQPSFFGLPLAGDETPQPKGGIEVARTPSGGPSVEGDHDALETRQLGAVDQVEAQADGHVRRTVDVEVTGSPMMHDFSLTENNVVI